MAVVQLRGLRRRHRCRQLQKDQDSAQPSVLVPAIGVLQSLRHRVRLACVFLVLS